MIKIDEEIKKILDSQKNEAKNMKFSSAADAINYLRNKYGEQYDGGIYIDSSEDPRFIYGGKLGESHVKIAEWHGYPENTCTIFIESSQKNESIEEQQDAIAKKIADALSAKFGWVLSKDGPYEEYYIGKGSNPINVKIKNDEDLQVQLSANEQPRAFKSIKDTIDFIKNNMNAYGFPGGNAFYGKLQSKANKDIERQKARDTYLHDISDSCQKNEDDIQNLYKGGSIMLKIDEEVRRILNETINSTEYEVIQEMVFEEATDAYDEKDIAKLKEAGCIIKDNDIIAPVGVKGYFADEDSVGNCLFTINGVAVDCFFDDEETRDFYVKIVLSPAEKAFIEKEKKETPYIKFFKHPKLGILSYTSDDDTYTDINGKFYDGYDLDKTEMIAI